MNSNGILPSIFDEAFQFGESQTDLVELLGVSTIERLIKKFNETSEEQLCLYLRELVKYLYLCSYSPTSLFFPGNILLDELWHALITETAEYRKLCHKLKPRNFVDHSGVTFADYAKSKTDEETNSEQLAWLASYKKNFGPFKENVVDILPMAKSISSKIGGGIKELNDLADSLVQISACEDLSEKSFNLDKFIESVVLPNATEIDCNVFLLKNILYSLISGISKTVDLKKSLPPNSDLEKIFGASTALAFTLWQHLAAVERLQSLPEWQTANLETWNLIVNGDKRCALATTHLARPGGASLKGKSTGAGFLISGTAPWVCGYGVFDSLLVGFESDSSIVFALIEFPQKNNQTFSATLQDMVCLNGTGTYSLKFSDHLILINEVVSTRPKDVQPKPRKSAYVIPELGIGKTALVNTNRIVGSSSHPRHILVKGVIPEMEARLGLIEAAKNKNENIDNLILMRDEFNRDAIRLFSIALGAQALNNNSLVSRLQLETFLFDSVVHSPSSLALKISKIGKRDE